MPVHINITAHSDGSFRLSQVRFNWPTQRLIESLPRKEWTGGDWKIQPADLLSVVALFTGAGSVELDQATSEALSQLRRKAMDAQPIHTVSDYQFREPAPFDHQRRAFGLGIRNAQFAFLMEMGTGKSRVTVDVLSYQIKRARLDGALIFSPKATLYNWENEIKTFSPLAPEQRRVAVVTGSGQEKRRILAQAAIGAQFVVTNYETALRLGPELRELMVRRRFAVVCDEATEIKNCKSKTFKVVEELGLIAFARYILTGTPVTQSPEDAYAMFRFLNRNILGHHTLTSFRGEYAISKRMPGVPWPVPVAYKNIDRLAKLIAPHSYRVLKAECLDLPEKVYRRVDLDMGPLQSALYTRMRDDALVEVEPGKVLAAPVVLTKLMRLQQIASGFLPVVDEFGNEVAVRAIEDAPKVEACMELVHAALASKQKVIVWCRFIWELEMVAARLTEDKIKHVLYHGEVPALERQQAVEGMQQGDTQVFVGQISTGGMGITLTSASTVIYFSNTFSLAERLQSEDRAHRIGQKRSVEYIDLVCRRTVDKLVLTALRDKKELADVVTGDNLRNLLKE